MTDNPSKNPFPGQLETEKYLHLLTANHHRIYAFIMTLVPNSNDADDIMQETTTVMWRKFNDFRPGSDFVAWGNSIAGYKILSYRRKKAGSPLRFNDKVFETIMAESSRVSSGINVRLDALENCVTKLNDTDRELIRKRYEQGSTVKEAASHFGKSAYSIYRALGRIHDLLLRCVRMTLLEEGSA